METAFLRAFLIFRMRTLCREQAMICLDVRQGETMELVRSGHGLKRGYGKPAVYSRHYKFLIF